MAKRMRLLGLSLAAAAALAPLAFAGEPARHFVAGWATSQQGLGQATITNATVRMIARVTVPGDQVRIRLNNTFGRTLVIGRASVGPRIHGAEIARGMNMLVSFNGGQAVTIPPGGSVVSDPVSLRVNAQQDLAVSLYVSGADVHPSQHNNAAVTSYVTDNGTGDQTASETGQPFTQRVTSMYWLKSIDVRANAAVSSIVAFGDSITDGTCSTLDANDRWEDVVARRYALQSAPRRAIVNEGIGGNTVTNAMNYNPAINSPTGVDRLERDVLSHPGVSHVVLFMGTNDIVRGAPAALVQNGIKDIVSRVHAKGLKIIGATIIPRANATWSPEKTKIKNEVNAWMKKDAGFDAILDFDRVVRDPKNPALIRADYDCGDAIHPSPIGYFRMGRAVDLAVFAK